MQKVGNEEVEKKTISIMAKANQPVSVDFVAHHLEVGWTTARGILLNMALKGLIEAEKTTKSMIFRLPRGGETRK